MLRLFSLFTILVAATAFTAQPWGVPTKSTSTARFMFSADDTPPAPLAEVSADAPVLEMDMEADKAEPSSMVRNMMGEATEVKWVDPAMRANTNPLEMNIWAYPLFGFPFVLLLNDAFHFIPKEGPLGYFGNM